VWKDGELLVNYAGPNLFNDQQPEFIMFGVYKAWWRRNPPSKRNTLTLYFDEIKIADHNSNFSQNDAPFPPTALELMAR
jgi:hypothetical protein